MNIPRCEHPNPQFERSNWENLNGKWEFEIDKSASGKDRKLFEAEKLSSEIIVPFCPESSLSGVCEKDFLNSVWYKRTINIPKTNDRVFLHIGACDYFTTVYINGKEIGTHKGGYSSFSFEITEAVNEGENTLVIHALDDNRTRLQPCGKQTRELYSCRCDYTRTTGIWQTVWLEYVPQNYIKSVKYYPDSNNGKLLIKALVSGKGTFSAKAFYEGNEVGSAKAIANGENADLTIDLSEIHLWEVGNGRLYDLELQFGEDRVKSYFGLRNVSIDGFKFILNNKSVFQRLVLDQGFYPDGIYTAPTEEAMIRDIELGLAAGFNGARLHEKVFEPRFLYHCDKAGYMVWGEYADVGLNHSEYEAIPTVLREWYEIINRDFNHPSIIGWCPFNETVPVNGKWQVDELIEMVYRTTKELDTTRPCIDASGMFHVLTDVFDYHYYEQDVEIFKEVHEKIAKLDFTPETSVLPGIPTKEQFYHGEALFASEFGGIGWWEDGDKDVDRWGYGTKPDTEEEFFERFKGLVETILNTPNVFGFCYTQLYDIEQEKNGLCTYDRKPKFDLEIFKKINSQKAAIED